MKKALTLLLALVVVLSLTLVVVACGDDDASETTEAATETTEAATETTEAAATVLQWSEAKDHLGETATVEGEVVEVEVLAHAAGKVLIKIGATDASGFAAGILGADAELFDDLEGLVGMTVRVTGEIYENEYDGHSEIGVTDPSQLEIVQ